MSKIANTLTSFELPAHDVRSKAAEAYRRAEAEQAERDRARRLELSEIPPRYLNADLQTCLPAVQDYAADVENGGTGWLLLIGENGRGKTYQACAALKRLSATRRVLFATMKRVVDTISENAQSAMSFCRIPVLLLDDLGKEDPAAWKSPHVFEVLDYRYTHLLPTIITTNLGSKAMLTHYAGRGSDAEVIGASIVSRLASARVVEVTGSDRRYQQ